MVSLVMMMMVALHLLGIMTQERVWVAERRQCLFPSETACLEKFE